MARTCQRFVTYTLDLRLRMAAHIWLATFSIDITQKRPSPLAIAVLTRPDRMSVTITFPPDLKAFLRKASYSSSLGRVFCPLPSIGLM